MSAGARRRPARGAPRLRARVRPHIGPAVMAGGVLLLGVLVLVGLRSTRPGVLPGTTVAGVEVGGLDRPALVSHLHDIAGQRRARQLQIVHGADAVTTSAGELGLAVDVEATADDVMARGRQLNPVASLRDHVLATAAALGWADVEVAVTESLDDTVFAAWVERETTTLGLDPVQGDVLFADGQAQVIPPPPGETIDAPALHDAVTETLADPTADVVEVPTTVSRPATTPEVLVALEADAERAVSAPVTLTRGRFALTVQPAQLADLLTVRAQPVTGDADAAALALAVDRRRLADLIPPEVRAELDSPPRDATFAISGGLIALVPAVDGFTFDASATARQLLELATGRGPRTAQMEGIRTPPDVSTEEASALGVVEEVASFTTEHPCCEGRVTNIHRIADIVDGTLVRPGEEMSLNELVGPRTTDAGFVDGGAISGGEFVEQIGGGVSQFTTTLFNAVFFGGYEILEFKPHSYYLSRYPVGREATLNYDPPVDLRWRNDSPHGVYVAATYTATSVTVSLWSTTYASVETTTSERYGFRPVTERREETDELPLGEEEVAEVGREGFSVDFTRDITFVDGRHRTEEYTTTYLAQPRIILVGTGTHEDGDEEPDATETPDAEGDGADTDDGGDSPTADADAGGTTDPQPAPAPPPPPQPAPPPAPPPEPSPAPPPEPTPAAAVPAG